VRNKGFNRGGSNMSKVVHNKLVRDNIPNIIIEAGKMPITRVLDEKQYIEELRRKLQEEVDEFLEDDNLQELADIIEVVESLARAKGQGIEAVMEIKASKQKKNGAFNHRIFLESVEG
jgi:predicted house-cleaning noncanonical NTP pyrophosphatase (MazG superfamily)